MRRLALLCSVCLVVAIALAVGEVGGASSVAAPVQKKTPAKKKRNVVDGALWAFVATARDGKQIRFRYRAADLVLLDPDSGDVIGKSEAIGTGRSRVTFDANSKFPAKFEIVRKAGPPSPRWSGRADRDGKSWDIQLTGLVN